LTAADFIIITLNLTFISLAIYLANVYSDISKRELASRIKEMVLEIEEIDMCISHLSHPPLGVVSATTTKAKTSVLIL
jgi:hypothetical protein